MTTTTGPTDLLQERIRRTSAPLLATRIRQARKEHGSHDALATAVESSRQHLIKLEKGLHRPRAGMLLKIAEATGHDVDWFLDESADPFRRAA